MQDFPTLDDIRQTQDRLKNLVRTTPVTRWADDELSADLGADTEVYVKLELLQVTGTFKPRGALNVMLSLSDEQKRLGVTAVSAGNHAIATAYSAKVLGTTAKVVMSRKANPLRLQMTRDLGAELVLVDSIHEAFEVANTLVAEEGRTFIHPYEGPLTLQGTGTVGLEITQQTPELDVMILPIGGGGLGGGIAAALKQTWPNIKIYGVEPEGAPSMYLSFQQNKPVALDGIHTIADSLGAPKAEPYSYGVCRKFIDEVFLITDDQMREAMKRLFYSLKVAVEPAGAATAAGMLGPLREKVRGKKVGIICCGANIAIQDFYDLTRG